MILSELPSLGFEERKHCLPSLKVSSSNLVIPTFAGGGRVVGQWPFQHPVSPAGNLLAPVLKSAPEIPCTWKGRTWCSALGLGHDPRQQKTSYYSQSEPSLLLEERESPAQWTTESWMGGQRGCTLTFTV